MSDPARTPTPEPPPRPDGVFDLAADVLAPAMERIAGRKAAAERSAANLAAAGIEPMVGIDEWAATLACSRREVERMRSAGRLPPPDLAIGRSPRWKAATVRRWIDAQATSRGGRTWRPWRP